MAGLDLIRSQGRQQRIVADRWDGRSGSPIRPGDLDGPGLYPHVGKQPRARPRRSDFRSGHVGNHAEPVRGCGELIRVDRTGADRLVSEVLRDKRGVRPEQSIDRIGLPG